jgi:hypothetical protein
MTGSGEVELVPETWTGGGRPPTEGNSHMSVDSTRAPAPASDPEATTMHDGETEAVKAATSRRAFLGGAGTAVAIGGLLAVVPKIANAGPSLEAQKAVDEAAEHIDVSLDDPLIVHVSDLSTGEISLYAGEQHIVIHDTDLANRLASAVTTAG